MAQTLRQTKEFIGERITAVTPLPSDPNVRSIWIGRRVVARIRAADSEAFELREGIVWSASLAARVEHAGKTDRARRDALRLLAIRDRSANELRDRLKRKDHADDVIEQIIDELRHDGWLNESALAASIARQVAEGGPVARELLMSRMQARAVDPAEAERATDEALDRYDAVREAVAWSKRKVKSDAKDGRTAARLARNLARRGLDDDVVRDVLRELDLPMPEDDRYEL